MGELGWERGKIAYLDGGIALIPLQKGWDVHRGFLGLSHVVLHSGVVGGFLWLYFGARAIQVLADHADTMLSPFSSRQLVWY
jgi:hypothetical protein